MTVEVAGGKARRLSKRRAAVEVGAGVDDLGPDAPAGDLDRLRLFDLDLFLVAEEEGWFCCSAALSAADSAAALSSSWVGTFPAWIQSCQNCPRAVLWPEPLVRPSCLCLFLVLDMCMARL